MCKEKLKVERDSGIQIGINGTSTEHIFSNSKTQASQGGAGTSGLSGIMNPNCDENCYFIEAKRIRVTFKNKENGQLEKKEVTVHQECLKQLELLKQQKSKEIG